jgi:GxxExxY protein
MVELLSNEEVFRIVGCGMEVYNELGSGFLEAVYQEALEFEFVGQEIPFESKPPLIINYKGHPLKKSHVRDLVVFGKVIADLKALDRLSGTEKAQMINYLKATGLRVGVLLNFGNPEKLEWKRFVK